MESGPYAVAVYDLRGKQVCTAWYRPGGYSNHSPDNLQRTVKLGEAPSEEAARELCRQHARTRRDA